MYKVSHKKCSLVFILALKDIFVGFDFWTQIIR